MELERAVLLYRILLAIVMPFIVARLALREPWRRLSERLGGGDSTPTGAVWMHAASNGEVVSARPLMDALLAKSPQMRLLVTVNTLTARDLVHGWADPRVTVRMAPLDMMCCLRRFWRRHNPCALIVIENEVWPNRFAIARARGLPVLIAGGRMSVRSGGRWCRTGLGGRLAAAITAVSAQDTTSEAGFAALGVGADKLLPMVNLKTAIRMPNATWSPGWARGMTVLAASTHEGEERIVLDAFAQARLQMPDLRLILAPRHPRRTAEVERLLADAGLGYTKRSDHVPASAPVLLADTMGEMANWYHAAAVCFVGGTLVDKGGHTPFEPVACGCAIVRGTYIANHRAPFHALDRAGAEVVVTGADDLAAAFAMGDGARDLAQRAQAALAPFLSQDAVDALAAAFVARIGACIPAQDKYL